MIKTSDIVNKVFTRSFMGYDVREVDAFLDDLITEVETLQRERLELGRTLEALLVERHESPALSSEAPRRLAESEGVKRISRPRRIASVPLEETEGLPEAAVREIAQSVALEIEVGAAAPRQKVIGPEIRKVAAQERALNGEDTLEQL